MHYSDRPIWRPDQDLLGRNGFSLELARSVDRLAVASDGFVIALLGEWGSGKSSVVELILRYIRHIEMERSAAEPLFGDIQAEPRSLDELEVMAGKFDLVEKRINELSLSGRDVTLWQRSDCQRQFEEWLESEEDARKAFRYWRLLTKVKAKPRTTVIRFSPWMIAGRAELASALLSEVARSLGDAFGDDVKRGFADLLSRLSEFAPAAGGALDLAGGIGIGGLIRGAGEWSRNAARRMGNGPTLHDVRDRLRVALADMGEQRILVVIDDLDRLTPVEAVEMVSLIKSVGDLPNVIYLLCYDEEKLNQLIGVGLRMDVPLSRGGGHNFLEKIVQYAVHLPPVDEAELTRMLDEDISRIVGKLSTEESKRLGITWHFVFRHYLRTPRDVRRYVNSIAVAISALADFVDPVDLLLLEAVKLFEPRMYSWIRQNLDDLVGA